MGRKWGPCAQPRCPVLTEQPYCDDHRPEAWAGSTRRARLPPDWDSLRLLVLERDGFTCTSCGAPGNRVDHIVAGDNHHPSNLTTLCLPCDRRKSGSEGGRAVHRRNRHA